MTDQMNTPTRAQALGEVMALSEKATPGPWDSDPIDNEGEYGDGGPDSHSRFKSFAICGERGHVIMDSLNSDAAMVEVEVDEDRAYAWDETARNNSAFIVALVNWARQHGQHFAGLEDECERLRTERRMAPVQGYAAGIPWSLHLEAYDAYCKRHGKQQALIEGGCRGGFGVNELDQFIPGWRDRMSEITQLRNRAEAAEARVREAEGLFVAVQTLMRSNSIDYRDISWPRGDSLADRIDVFLAARGGV